MNSRRIKRRVYSLIRANLYMKRFAITLTQFGEELLKEIEGDNSPTAVEDALDRMAADGRLIVVTP